MESPEQTSFNKHRCPVKAWFAGETIHALDIKIFGQFVFRGSAFVTVEALDNLAVDKTHTGGYFVKLRLSGRAPPIQAAQSSTSLRAARDSFLCTTTSARYKRPLGRSSR